MKYHIKIKFLVIFFSLSRFVRVRVLLLVNSYVIASLFSVCKMFRYVWRSHFAEVKQKLRDKRDTYTHISALIGDNLRAEWESANGTASNNCDSIEPGHGQFSVALFSRCYSSVVSHRHRTSFSIALNSFDSDCNYVNALVWVSAIYYEGLVWFSCRKIVIFHNHALNASLAVTTPRRPLSKLKQR